MDTIRSSALAMTLAVALVTAAASAASPTTTPTTGIPDVPLFRGDAARTGVESWAIEVADPDPVIVADGRLFVGTALGQLAAFEEPAGAG